MESQRSPAHKLWRRCCCLSLGTATTTWACFLILFATFQWLSGGVMFTGGAALSVVATALLLWASIWRKAPAALTAYHIQVVTLVVWVIQLIYIIAALIHVLVRSVFVTSMVLPLIDLISWFIDTDRAIRVYMALLICFYIGLIAGTFFMLRVLWSFYRVLEVGGTTYEFKTADDLESSLLGGRPPPMENYHSTDRPNSRRG